MICYNWNEYVVKEYRFYFLSHEETRMHAHVEGTKGEAKFWIEPIVSLASYCGLPGHKLAEIQKIAEKRKDDIIKEWKTHVSQR